MGQVFQAPVYETQAWGLDSISRRIPQATLCSVRGCSQIRALARGLLSEAEEQNEWEKAGGLGV